MKPQTHEHPLENVAKPMRRRRIDAALVSSDDSLLIELGPLLGDDYRTHMVDAPASLADLPPKAGWLAIVDVAAISDARAAVARLVQRHPQMPLIIVAADTAAWGALVGRGAIVAAVDRDQLSGPRFTEALAAAAARVGTVPTLEAAGSGNAGIAAPGEALRAATTESSPPTGGSVLRRALPWTLLGAVLIAVGGWLLRPVLHPTGRGPAVHGSAQNISGASAISGAAPDVGANAGSAASRSQTILELLSAARVQFHDQKLLFPRPDGEPRGDSALELYAQVLSQDPSNAEALDGISRLWGIGKSRIQADVASGKLDDASRLIALFKAAAVSDELLQPMNASVNAARPKWLASRAQQSVAAGDLATAAQLAEQLAASGADAQTLGELRRALDAKRLDQQLTGMAVQVQSAVTAGALLAPATDSAMDRLEAMRALSRNHSVTLGAQRDVRAALLARAQQAIRQQQFDQASRYLGAAGELGSSTDLSELRRQLQDDTQRAVQATNRAAATAASTVPAAAAQVQPASPILSPSPPNSPAPTFLAAAPVRALNVAYPDQVQGVEGRVVVEFTLHADGSASDLAIVDAKPRGTFDRAALAAVRRGRYDVRGLVAGQPARARISLHFKPE